MPERWRCEQTMLARKPVLGNRTHVKPGITLVVMLLAAGCVGAVGDTEGDGPSSGIIQAQRDHARCVEEGHSHPSQEYTWCRQALQDERERRRLRSLALIEQEEGGIGPDDPLFRPSTRRGPFTCEARGSGEHRWIDCRVREER